MSCDFFGQNDKAKGVSMLNALVSATEFSKVVYPTNVTGKMTGTAEI